MFGFIPKQYIDKILNLEAGYWYHTRNFRNGGCEFEYNVGEGIRIQITTSGQVWVKDLADFIHVGRSYKIARLARRLTKNREFARKQRAFGCIAKAAAERRG